MTVAEQYRAAAKRLSTVTEEAQEEANLILAHVYGCGLGAVVMRFLHQAAHERRVEEIINKRLLGIPLAYVLHEKNFYGYDFYVDGRVLIPRRDTESVVEFAVQTIRERGYASALDLCCGSGCIGTVLLRESGIKRVFFSDVSDGALAVARKNVEKACVSDRAVFLQGDLFSPVEHPVDCIVCNPPYVSGWEYETLSPEVKNYEPARALVADHDGYAFYERLARQSGEYLNPGGTAVFEIGCTQYETVAGLLTAAGFANIKCGYDMEGRPRFVSCDNAASAGDRGESQRRK